MANLVLSGIHCLCNCWANVQISLTLLPAMLSIKLEGWILGHLYQMQNIAGDLLILVSSFKLLWGIIPRGLLTIV